MWETKYFNSNTSFVRNNLQNPMHCRYNYTREDEEVYKEFLEIATDLIPDMMKLVSSNGVGFRLCMERVPFLEDAECYAYLLRFYDGICLWEEGSNTPVLHITWAKQFTFSLAKFDPKVRGLIRVDGGEEEEEEEEEDRDSDGEERKEPVSESTSDYINDFTDRVDFSELLSSRSNGSPFPGMTMDSMLKADSPADLMLCSNRDLAKVTFHSQKMAGLRKLLTSAEKFNSSAIRLQLTAQSQVHIKHAVHSKRSSESYEYSALKKRSRRE